MLGVATLLLVVGLSLVINRIASVSLELTGMSRDSARFQARSAFTGAGFTTVESEQVVAHPVRRKIVATLMFVGNIGIVSLLASATGSVVAIRDEASPWVAYAVAFGGLGMILGLSRSRFFDRLLCSGIAWALRRWTELDARDYAGLLHLGEGYGVNEAKLRPSLSGQTIEAAGFDVDGVLVLGVMRKSGAFEGAPTRNTVLAEGDTLYLYGQAEKIATVCRGS